MDATTTTDPLDLAPNERPIANFDTAPIPDEWAMLDDLESSGAFDAWDDRAVDGY